MILKPPQGVPFEYKDKGKAIPPPKDRKPQHADYQEIQPSKDAHISEQRARPAQKEEPQKPANVEAKAEDDQK